MKYCNSCNMYINSNSLQCPLCYKKTTDNTKTQIVQDYPKYSVVKVKNNKLELFINTTLILATLISILLNIIFYCKKESLWCVLATVVFISIWLLSRLVLFSKRNLSLKLSLFQTSLLFIMIAYDYLYSSEQFKYWSITYAIAFVASIGLISIVCVVITKRDTYPDYFGNIILNIFGLLVPIILYFTIPTFITNVIPAIIAFIVAVLTIISLFIFPTKTTKDEILKRLHI